MAGSLKRRGPPGLARNPTAGPRERRNASVLSSQILVAEAITSKTTHTIDVPLGTPTASTTLALIARIDFLEAKVQDLVQKLARAGTIQAH